MKPKHIWFILYIPLSIAIMYFPINSHKFADWWFYILSGVVTNLFYVGEELIVYFGAYKEQYPTATKWELLNKPVMREIYTSYWNIALVVFCVYTLIKTFI